MLIINCLMDVIAMDQRAPRTSEDRKLVRSRMPLDEGTPRGSKKWSAGSAKLVA